MGLGKTIQLIAFLASLSYTGSTSGRWTGLGPSLIVCPATVLRQWVAEFHAWWPPLRVAILHSSGSHAGSPRNLIRAMNSTPGGILVMSYAAVAAHAEQLAGLDWHYVVLDEGHKIRNPEAQVLLFMYLYRWSRNVSPQPELQICSAVDTGILNSYMSKICVIADNTVTVPAGRELNTVRCLLT
jgi:DNA excision repair protein ERCC-6